MTSSPQPYPLDGFDSRLHSTEPITTGPKGWSPCRHGLIALFPSVPRQNRCERGSPPLSKTNLEVPGRPFRHKLPLKLQPQQRNSPDCSTMTTYTRIAE